MRADAMRALATRLRKLIDRVADAMRERVCGNAHGITVEFIAHYLHSFTRPRLCESFYKHLRAPTSRFFFLRRNIHIIQKDVFRTCVRVRTAHSI